MLINIMTFSAIVNNNYLQISHHFGQLHINHVTIDMPFDICSLTVSNDKIYVVYSKIRHDGFYLIDSDIPLNNIVAYDFFGKCVWKIEDVWGKSAVVKEQMKLGLPFCGVEWHTSESYIKYVPYKSSYNKISASNKHFEVTSGHEYLVCHTIMGERYTLDLTVDEIVHIANE